MLRFLFFASLIGISYQVVAQTSEKSIIVKSTDDFELTGKGSSKWDAASWNVLPVTQGEDKRQTRFKTMYSATGIYFLFHNEDRKLSASKTNDFDRLWYEDVSEVFLWPDTTHT